MKRYTPFFIIGFILFITLGDKVLPGQLGKSSAHTRTAFNNFALNLFPNVKPPKNPYERTEKKIEEVDPKK